MAELPKPKPGWQAGKSPIQCHRYMLDNQISCDVAVRFSGSTDVIGAHAYMLMCRSPVFESMFAGNLIRNPGSVISIDLPGVDPEAFKEVLRYIYYDGANVTGRNVISVLHGAKTYQLDGLAAQCMTYLQRNTSAANVCTLLNTCSVEEVVQMCLQYVRNHPAHVLRSAHFLNLNEEALHRLLSVDLVCDRAKVVEAALRWANHERDRLKSTTSPKEASLRDVLGRCFYRLGFTSMTSSQLAAVVKETAILSDVEQLALFRYAAMPDEEVTSSLDALGFSVIPAVYTSPSCYRSLEQRQIPNGGQVSSTLTFILDNNIILQGFTVHGTTKSGTYRLSAELTNSDGLERDLGGVVCKFETKLWSRGSKEPIRMILPTAVELAAVLPYCLRVTMSDIRESASSMYRGVDQMSHVAGDHCTLTLTIDQSEDGGFISQIIYSLR
ncbi:hypothetical protein LSH36_824g01033 [Paralvinella palmiformis]|uniref:BTB domain-containing protein n=1 Tax=Paralvinella palmiformis TaxID=53620 RepID=A0AAD9J077_9ANNE|nr:hypothetical protein LSH36_824g01033 [Paralvinella palmiformis]